MAFHTPEEYFLNEPVLPFVRQLDLTPFLPDVPGVEAEAPEVAHVTAVPAASNEFKKINDQDIVSPMWAVPAAGKSHILLGDLENLWDTSVSTKTHSRR